MGRFEAEGNLLHGWWIFGAELSLAEGKREGGFWVEESVMYNRLDMMEISVRYGMSASFTGSLLYDLSFDLLEGR